MNEHVLHWGDYLVLVAFLVISLGIGVYHSLSGGRQRTTTEFIMANRSLGVIPTALSMMVSFQSAIMILSGTSEFYSYGAQHLLMLNFTVLVSIIITERIVVPWMFPLQLVSVYEYLDLRFKSKAVRATGAALGILGGLAYMGTAMYAPSAALQAVTGLPLLVSIPIMAVVSVTYTALGGMRAVIWTDVFQFGVMMVGIAAILIKGLIVAGGFGVVSELSSQQGRLIWANWSPDPTERHTVWGYMIGFNLSWIFVYGLNQAAVQRYSATNSLKKARRTIILNIPAIIILHTIVCYTGAVVVAYYAKQRCDPITNKEVENANQLLPYFVTRHFANIPGFSGLFLATLYGGALSSVSSSLSGAAANCWEDMLKFKLDHLKETTKAYITRALVVVFGLTATLLSFLASIIPGTLTQVSMSFHGSIAGPLFGMFLLGGLTRISNAKGTMIGAVCGFAINLWINFASLGLKNKHKSLPPLPIDGCPSLYGNNGSTLIASDGLYNYSSLITTDVFTATVNQMSSVEHQLTGLEKLYSMSYVWLTLLGCTITVLVGFLASLPFRNKMTEYDVEEKLFIPWNQFFNCKNSGEEVKVPAKEEVLLNPGKNSKKDLEAEADDYINNNTKTARSTLEQL